MDERILIRVRQALVHSEKQAQKISQYIKQTHFREEKLAPTPC